jgi:hypothetical protein
MTWNSIRTRAAASAVVVLVGVGITVVTRAAQAPARGGPPPAPAAGSQFVPPEPIDYANRDGWTQIFDGRTLAGWDGNPDVWSVADGTITANSVAERRVGSTHLIWQGGELADFEWKFELKLGTDIHAGVAYRSYVDLARGRGRQGSAGRAAGAGAPPAARAGGPGIHVPADPRWTLYGPGLDYDYDLIMAGNVEDRGTPRREVAWRGLIVHARTGERPRAIGQLGDADALKAVLRPDDWNQVHIVARGRQISHIINGHLMTVLIDDDDTYFRPSGLIGFQIEQWGVGRVSVRDVWIRRH